MDIHVTPDARARIDDYLGRHGFAGRPVRLRVKRSKCMGGRGHSYDLDVADAAAPDDLVVESEGVRVLVDPASAALLADVRIERLGDGPLAALDVKNSRATGRCPCGNHDILA